MDFKQMMNQVVCAFKGHEDIYVGSELPHSQQSLYYCPKCGTFYVWHSGIACGYRECNVNRLPKKMRKSAKSFLKEFVEVNRNAQEEGEN